MEVLEKKSFVVLTIISFCINTMSCRQVILPLISYVIDNMLFWNPLHVHQTFLQYCATVHVIFW